MVSSLRYALLCWVVPECKMQIAVHDDRDYKMVKTIGSVRIHVLCITVTVCGWTVQSFAKVALQNL